MTALATALLSTPPALAQTASNPAGERTQLALELFEASGGQDRVDEALSGLMASLDVAYLRFYEQLADELEFADEAGRSAFLGRYPENQREFSAAFHAELEERLDLTRVVRDVIVPLYAEMYTVAELRELVSFYRSPLGSKVVSTQPQRLARATQQILSTVAPELRSLMQEVLVRERERLAGAATR